MLTLFSSLIPHAVKLFVSRFHSKLTRALLTLRATRGSYKRKLEHSLSRGSLKTTYKAHFVQFNVN